MIEMRWYRDAEAVAGGCKAVLQYRYYKMHQISGDTFMGNLAEWAMEWTPWMDVPPVYEHFAALPEGEKK